MRKHTCSSTTIPLEKSVHECSAASGGKMMLCDTLKKILGVRSGQGGISRMGLHVAWDGRRRGGEGPRQI